MADVSISNGTDSVGGLVLVSYTADRAASTVVHNIVGRSSPIAVLGSASTLRFGADALRHAGQSGMVELR